mmetsp:Transcript_111049/g.265055  ORF Transcript_111049/g.265055 Transcript_111049/m.265055 type:complete len:208 (+) Transcript_111049:134-757(+)
MAGANSFGQNMQANTRLDSLSVESGKRITLVFACQSRSFLIDTRARALFTSSSAIFTSVLSLSSMLLAPKSLAKGSKNSVSNLGPVGLFKRVTTSRSCGGICCKASAAVMPLPFFFSACSHAFTAVPTRACSRCAWTFIRILYQLSTKRQAGQRAICTAACGSRLGSDNSTERTRSSSQRFESASTVCGGRGCCGSSSGKMSASTLR